MKPTIKRIIVRYIRALPWVVEIKQAVPPRRRQWPPPPSRSHRWVEMAVTL
jgi:hypothetical protein